MAHSEEDKKRLLEILADTPFINQACKTMGIHRSTLYRWKHEDPTFKERLNEALREGRANITELGELSLLSLVHNKHFGAIKFLLQKNSERYEPKLHHPPLKEPEQKDPEQKDFEFAHLNTDLTPYQRDVMFHWVKGENDMLRRKLEKYEAPGASPPPPQSDPSRPPDDSGTGGQ